MYEAKIIPINIPLPDHDLALEREMYDAIIANFQVAFGLSREELEALTAGEHFNHQY